MTRSDVTVRQIKVEDLLFPASPGAYSIVSHPPKIAAGWGILGRDGEWASPPRLEQILVILSQLHEQLQLLRPLKSRVRVRQQETFPQRQREVRKPDISCWD